MVTVAPAKAEEATPTAEEEEAAALEAEEAAAAEADAKAAEEAAAAEAAAAEAEGKGKGAGAGAKGKGAGTGNTEDARVEKLESELAALNTTFEGLLDKMTDGSAASSIRAEVLAALKDQSVDKRIGDLTEAVKVLAEAQASDGGSEGPRERTGFGAWFWGKLVGR